jgi:hypothetical protein
VRLSVRRPPPGVRLEGESKPWTGLRLLARPWLAQPLALPDLIAMPPYPEALLKGCCPHRTNSPNLSIILTVRIRPAVSPLPEQHFWPACRRCAARWSPCRINEPPADLAAALQTSSTLAFPPPTRRLVTWRLPVSRRPSPDDQGALPDAGMLTQVLAFYQKQRAAT